MAVLLNAVAGSPWVCGRPPLTPAQIDPWAAAAEEAARPRALTDEEERHYERLSAGGYGRVAG